MLLFNTLQTLLQMHNLIHVVILSHCVVLFSQQFIVKLNQLAISTVLRKALKNVVAIAGSLSDRTHSVVCTLQRQSFEAGKVGYLCDLRKLLDWII